MLHLFLSLITIFKLIALLFLLTVCLPSSCSLTAQSFLLPLTPILSSSNTIVNQYSQSFIPFSCKLWNSLPAYVFPSSYDLLSFKKEVSRHLSLSSG
ncbi:hypothetical protein E2C01_045881 [Portunus trituberculatus]|uniref:Uncharacterized protein n=1 Tax=Portunus trituberculatus TaxID=210409 RepID=A0A5B7FZF3_PORTR|nr:hypothetical protein [Portunus trituberculatus]